MADIIRPYSYPMRPTRILDGDTLDADIDLGFDLSLHGRIRLMDINCPETRTKNIAEKRRGLMARARLRELCPIGKKCYVISHGKGKYGRILGTIIIESSKKSVNAILLAEGLATEYK